MSFNFVNLVGIWIFYYIKFFHVTCMCIVIEMAAYKMESSVRGYHHYKDYGCIDWRRYFDNEDQYAVAVATQRLTPLLAIFRANLFSVFSKGWCYNLYAYRRKEVFFTPGAEYICYNFGTKYFQE